MSNILACRILRKRRVSLSRRVYIQAEGRISKRARHRRVFARCDSYSVSREKRIHRDPESRRLCGNFDPSLLNWENLQEIDDRKGAGHVQALAKLPPAPPQPRRAPRPDPRRRRRRGDRSTQLDKVFPPREGPYFIKARQFFRVRSEYTHIRVFGSQSRASRASGFERRRHDGAPRRVARKDSQSVPRRARADAPFYGTIYYGISRTVVKVKSKSKSKSKVKVKVARTNTIRHPPPRVFPSEQLVVVS